VSDLADQQAPRGQVACALFQNAADEVQSIVPARERAPRLATVFCRKPAHACRSDVGWIADDQVVAPATEAGKQIRLDETHAVPESVKREIASRDRQRGPRVVARVDARAGKRLRRGHREAPATRAKVEYLAHRSSDPWFQALAQKLGDERARHDHAPIHVEAQAPEPGLAQQIGRRRPRADAPVDQRAQTPGLAPGQALIGQRCQGLRRKIEKVQDEECGLVARVVRAVAIVQSGGTQACDGLPKCRGDGRSRNCAAPPHPNSRRRISR